MTEKNEDQITLTAILEAVKELTKTVADFAKEHKELAKQIELARKAGKF